MCDGKLFVFVAVVLCVVQCASAFVAHNPLALRVHSRPYGDNYLRSRVLRLSRAQDTTTRPCMHAEDGASSGVEAPKLGRRGFLSLAVAATGFGLHPFTLTTSAQAAPVEPITVFGATGESGLLTVETLIKKGHHVRRVLRGPVDPLADLYKGNKQVQTVIADVTDAKAVQKAVAGSKAVIVAIGTKLNKETGEKLDLPNNTPKMVDHMGVVNVATSCIKSKVPRLVVMSSICGRCKDHKGEDFCETCDCKAEGEAAIRDLYAKADPSLSYAVARAGQLVQRDSPNFGPSKVELNQGGEKTGVITREDFAELLVATAESNNANRVTFDAYYTATARPQSLSRAMNRCIDMGITDQECMNGRMYRSRREVSLREGLDTRYELNENTLFPTGYESYGQTYFAMFGKLRKDGEIVEKEEDSMLPTSMF